MRAAISEIELERRAVIVAEPVSPELARSLAAAGLELRIGGDHRAPDVLLADPRVVSASEAGIEEIIATRIGELLARVGDGDGMPALHMAVIDQAERGLFRAVLDHTSNHLGRASKLLGLDRNTCARKARAFGLLDEPSRGRKPRAIRLAAKGRKSAAASRKPAAKAAKSGRKPGKQTR